MKEAVQETPSGFLKNLAHIHINCGSDKFEETVAFYEVLGFKLERIISYDDVERELHIENVPVVEDPDGRKHRVVGMGISDDPRATTRIEIMGWEDDMAPAPANPEKTAGIARFAISVKNAAAIAERVEAAGFHVGESGSFRINQGLSAVYYHLYDPSGTWLSLLDWIKD